MGVGERGRGRACPRPGSSVVRRRALADVTTADGMRMSGAAARRLVDSVPRSSRDARASRWRVFTTWCGEHGWDTTEPGAVLSHLSDLADLGHPTGTLRGLRQIGTSPLTGAEIRACQRLITHRADEEADDPTVELWTGRAPRQASKARGGALLDLGLLALPGRPSGHARSYRQSVQSRVEPLTRQDM
ncbi:hypothetical protein ABZ714_22975 [Streptomyces sp. NPDC006798]|uniref:hypothetical protein n=1 Tax=Streptomyces sp. NPDC006798 TaxID=3155462 RepID=UPI0033C09E89